MLTRSEFCILAGIDSEGLKNRNRYRQLPFNDDHRPRGKYSEYEALLFILAQDLAASPIGSNLTAAGEIVGIAAQYLMGKLGAVNRTSRDLCEDRDTDEILIAVVWFPGRGGPKGIFAGTFDEISKAIRADGRPIVRAIMLNATRAAMVLRNRADRAKIDIGDLFGDAD